MSKASFVSPVGPYVFSFYVYINICGKLSEIDRKSQVWVIVHNIKVIGCQYLTLYGLCKCFKLFWGWIPYPNKDGHTQYTFSLQNLNVN